MRQHYEHYFPQNLKHIISEYLIPITSTCSKCLLSTYYVLAERLIGGTELSVWRGIKTINRNL